MFYLSIYKFDLLYKYEVGGSNSSQNATNNSTSTLGSSGGSKDHNNNLIKRGGTNSNTIASNNELNFRDYSAPLYGEQLSAHNQLTFKLVKTGMCSLNFVYFRFFLSVCFCSLIYYSIL